MMPTTVDCCSRFDRFRGVRKISLWVEKKIHNAISAMTTGRALRSLLRSSPKVRRFGAAVVEMEAMMFFP
jgi:hypothetical protein